MFCLSQLKIGISLTNWIFVIKTLFLQRVITMLSIVVALFILSWGPLLTYTLIYRFIEDMPYNTHAVLSLFLHLLAACNSCVNPIIYAFLSKNFRQSFKQVIRECCCCCESLHQRRLAYQPSVRWTSSTRASYSYAAPESCMRNSPQRSTVSQKTDVWNRWRGLSNLWRRYAHLWLALGCNDVVPSDYDPSRMVTQKTTYDNGWNSILKNLCHPDHCG